jgi:dolichyl-phosphate-mannose-protein mannosyltransferase
MAQPPASTRHSIFPAAGWEALGTRAAYDRGVTSASLTDDTDLRGDGDIPPGQAATASTARAPAVPAQERVPDVVRRRLAPAMPPDGTLAWVGTVLVVAMAAVLRLIGLEHPRGKIFDEVYYATEGHDLLTHGVEWNPTTNTGNFVVHPPLGKWLIGLGEKMFGYHEFGWRIMPMVVGTLSILILIRVTRRMFRSTVLGLAAGLLMSLDGMEFVLSRTALLDIFLMFFILAAFGCLVMDRDSRRRRWLRALEAGLDPSRAGRAGRPRTSWRESIPWWRLAGAVMIGCAMSVKWSALWYIILYVGLIVFWEVGLRRSAGVARPWRDTLLDETGWVIAFGLVLTGVYLASWTGWLLTDAGYDRHYLQATGHHEVPILGALQNLVHYHYDALHFHFGLDAPHTYQSWPWQWLLLGRPVAFYYSNAAGCGGPSCSAEVLLLGTPLLWWSFLPALVGVAGYGIARRDWRAIAIFLGAFAGIAPWFLNEFSHRTMFYFYSLPSLPFMIMAVLYIFGALIHGPKRATFWSPYGRMIGTGLLAAYLLAVGRNFMYFYPLYVGQKITYTDWFHHMWLGGRWI